MDKIKQFLADEQELLTDLALDVANAETDFEYAKTKAAYSVQMARVSGIKDTIAMLEEK
ncbi:hypothetical protein AAGS61_08655 [Lysinibacillus sp. KU-BSD001]|uniref:hypothetical protein n=1 Tax=Lysinibacillus sp. KU-BSD001 TaxID=3141328 RepID=UPI0036EF186D